MEFKQNTLVVTYGLNLNLLMEKKRIIKIIKIIYLLNYN